MRQSEYEVTITLLVVADEQPDPEDFSVELGRSAEDIHARIVEEPTFDLALMG